MLGRLWRKTRQLRDLSLVLEARWDQQSGRRNSTSGKGQVGDSGDRRTGAAKKPVRVGDREVRLWDRSQGPSVVGSGHVCLGLGN